MNDLNKYIDNHRIIQISKTEYAEILVDDPIGFVKEILSRRARISEITWWEHIRIDEQNNSLGGGGPIDTRNKGYMWSEIYYISKKFEKSASEETVIEYINSVKEQYNGHDIYPAFDIIVETN